MEEPRDSEPAEGEVIVPQVAAPPVSHMPVPVAPGHDEAAWPASSRVTAAAGGLALGVAAYALVRLLRRR